MAKQNKNNEANEKALSKVTREMAHQEITFANHEN